MSFAWPHVLWLLLAPVGLLAWELSRRRRTSIEPAHPKILRAEAGGRELSLAPARGPAAFERQARPWLLAGLALAIVALARPQWGRLDEPVFDQSREILLAIDLSRSMLTPDVKPSRLDRAKLLIQSLLEKLAGERVGLLVFSGTAFLQSPLSSDYEILREFLPSLDPDYLPEGGTNYGALIDAAIQAFGNNGTADRFLIILSDGEANDEEWRSRVDTLKARGIRVIGLGIGTVGGAMIPDGSGGFVKDDRGAVVLSKLESSTLQQLADATNGTYRDASLWLDLAGLLKSTVEAGQKGKFVDKNTVRRVERYQWPLALALWCALVSLCYEFPVRPRPRDLVLRTPENAKRPPARPPAAKSPAVAALLLCALCLLGGLQSHADAAEPEETAPAASQPLARMVGRLSVAPVRTARDWADLGRETVTWGSRLQSDGQSVPEGPVRDALQAVDLGENLDSKLVDWPKLREELERLLQKPNEQKQEQNQQQNPQQQRNQDQNEQRQNQSQDQQQSQSQQSPPQEENSSNPNQKNQPFDQNVKPPEDQPPKPGEPAFGDMKQKQELPPPSETQKVGGAPEQKDEPKERTDPVLALPLQKLDQLRNQDSPARLFELMEGDKKTEPKKPGKDW
jgi:Ca-activated chloride channel family protein